MFTVHKLRSYIYILYCICVKFIFGIIIQCSRTCAVCLVRCAYFGDWKCLLKSVNNVFSLALSLTLFSNVMYQKACKMLFLKVSSSWCCSYIYSVLYSSNAFAYNSQINYCLSVLKIVHLSDLLIKLVCVRNKRVCGCVLFESSVFCLANLVVCLYRIF